MRIRRRALEGLNSRHSPAKNARGGHDVYENNGTYMEFGRFARIVILLMINDLSVFSRSGA